MPLSWGPLVIFTPPTARILPAGTWPWPGHGQGSVGTAARGTPTSQAGWDPRHAWCPSTPLEKGRSHSGPRAVEDLA